MTSRSVRRIVTIKTNRVSLRPWMRCPRVDEFWGIVRVRIAWFTGVDYVDSAGVGVLIAKYLSVRRKGGDLKLLRLSPRPLHVLEISHLRTVFQVFDSEEDAVSSFEA